MAQEVVPFIAKPVGWKRCFACKDYKRHPGKMWLGYNHATHEDIMIDCPQCKGTGQIEVVKHYDVRTGLEIDYERPDQKFVYLGEESHG
jgi:hypothetical protein